MAVQDYKINYKSDFVLNINGDAGWAVPFCIKFWTGMPSQAYFVGFDGVKYVNCRVGDTPTQLLVMFDDHHLSIGKLMMQIAYHTTIEEFPGSVFDEVTNARDVIVTIDGTDYQVMLDFTGEDAPELEFNLPAYANEAERIQNELQRQQNEADRIEAELQREQATAAAVQGAENVNAQLSGNILTVTNRNGVSTSVNTKGEQGEQGPVGPEGPQGQKGVSVTGLVKTGETETDTLYNVTFSDGTTQAVAIPKGAKGDTGATGPTGPQGPQGQTGVSITGLVKTGETETDTLYNVTFSNGTTQAVAIPKGEKGDQGPVGPEGPQGPMGDVAVITPEQQAAFTMYSVPGQNTNGPMTQKAVTDALVADSINTVVYTEDYNLEYLKQQGYIALNGSTASLTPVSDSGWRCVVCPCESYDVFEVTGYGGNASRVYGFLDSNLNVIRVADASQYKQSAIVAAPYGSAYFIANGVNNDVTYNKLSVSKLQKGNLEQINEHELYIKGSYDAIFEMGGGDTSNFNLVESNKRLRMCKPMPILDGASYTLNVGFSIGYSYVVFYYLNNVGVSYVSKINTIRGDRNIEITPSSSYDSFRIIIFPNDPTTHTFTNTECNSTFLAVRGISLDDKINNNSGQFQVPFNINSDYWEQGNIDGSTGSNIDSTNAIRTFSYIAVEYGQVWHYSMNAGYRLAFLFFISKSSNGYISVKQWLTGSGDVTIPANAKYIRLVIAAPSGSSVLPVFDSVGLTLVSNKKMVVSDFAADAGYYELLGNNDIIWENGAIDTSSGDNITQNNRIRTKYAYKVGKNFYVGANTQYRSMAVLYDAYGNVVNRDGLLTTTRLYQTHDEYYVRFVLAKLNDSAISVDEVNIGDVMIPVPTPNAHTYNYGIDFNADNVTVAEVYRHLHDITFRHSNYITETTLGLDASGDYEIRAYMLGSGSKKIFIVGGQHGPQSDPWDSVITIARFITQLADTTYDSDFADHLRDEYTLYIVPMCNPYGLDHYNIGQNDQTAFIGGRHNYNGVNLNRDWGVFSQPETTLVNTFMLSVQPDAVMDVHTLGDTYTTGTSTERGRVYLSSGNTSIRNDFSGLFSQKLMKYYNCGTVVDNNTTANTLKEYAESVLSVYGMTIECDWWIWGVAEPHSAEMESANMSLLVNSIKMFAARIEEVSYLYEKVPKQAQSS